MISKGASKDICEKQLNELFLIVDIYKKYYVDVLKDMILCSDLIPTIIEYLI